MRARPRRERPRRATAPAGRDFEAVNDTLRRMDGPDGQGRHQDNGGDRALRASRSCPCASRGGPFVRRQVWRRGGNARWGARDGRRCRRARKGRAALWHAWPARTPGAIAPCAAWQGPERRADRTGVAAAPPQGHGHWRRGGRRLPIPCAPTAGGGGHPAPYANGRGMPPRRQGATLRP